MNISNTKLHRYRLFLLLGAMCSLLSVVISDTASSQTTPNLYLEVIESAGTYFKRGDYWTLQSPEISQPEQRCYATRNSGRLRLSSVDYNTNSNTVGSRDTSRVYFGNVERLRDYYTVTFAEPPCNRQGNNTRTWNVYKQHVRIITETRQ